MTPEDGLVQLEMSDAADAKKYNRVVVRYMKMHMRTELKQLKFENDKVIAYIVADVFSLHALHATCSGIDEEQDAALLPDWFPLKNIADYRSQRD